MNRFIDKRPANSVTVAYRRTKSDVLHLPDGQPTNAHTRRYLSAEYDFASVAANYN